MGFDQAPVPALSYCSWEGHDDQSRYDTPCHSR
jgi:hypothetical protein